MSSALLQAILGGAKGTGSVDWYKPGEHALGIGANAIGSAAPYLYNPYQSTGRNIGTTVGAGLLAGLLGGLANKSTTSRNADLAQSVLEYGSASPERQAEILKTNPRMATYGVAHAQKLQEELRKQEEFKKQEIYKHNLKFQDEVGPGFTGVPTEAPVQQPGQELQSALGGQPTKPNVNTSAYKSQQDKIKNERALAADFQKVAEPFRYKVETMAALEEAYKDTSGVSDFELIRRGSQMVEPGLAVRRDDEQSLQRAASLWGVSVATLQGIASGKTRLEPGVRKGIMRMAQRSLNSSVESYNKERERILSQVESYQLNPEHIVAFGPGSMHEGDYSMQQAVAQQGGQPVAQGTGGNNTLAALMAEKQRRIQMQKQQGFRQMQSIGAIP